MKSNCDKCSHKELCKYRESINSEEILAKIQNDYPFVADFDFACKFFDKKEKIITTVESVKPVKHTKTVRTKKITVFEKSDSKINKVATKEKDANDQPVNSDDDQMDFEDIRIIDFGLSNDTTSELLHIGGKEMKIKDLKEHIKYMSPKCKNELNAKLSAFHRSL